MTQKIVKLTKERDYHSTRYESLVYTISKLEKIIKQKDGYALEAKYRAFAFGLIIGIIIMWIVSALFFDMI